MKTKENICSWQTMCARINPAGINVNTTLTLVCMKVKFQLNVLNHLEITNEYNSEIIPLTFTYVTHLRYQTKREDWLVKD